MARAYDSDVLIDAAGNAIAAAVGTLWTDEAASVAVSDAYTAASGGSPVTQVTTNASGKYELWFTTPKTYYIKWANAGHTAYPAGSPSTLLDAWTPFVSRHQAFEDPADEMTDTATSITVSDTGGYFTGTNVETVLQSLGRANIDYINILDYGADPNIADNGAKVNDAIAAAVSLDINTIYCPDPTRIDSTPVASAGYGCTTTINLEGKSNLRFVGYGGVKLPGGFQPTVNFYNTTNTNPIVSLGDPDAVTAPAAPTDGITFDGIGFYQPSARAVVGNWVRTLVLRSVSIVTFAATPAIHITNSFWLWHRDVSFYNGGTTQGCVKYTARSDGNLDVSSVYLARFYQCQFSGGPFVEYEYAGGSSIQGSLYFEGCDGENQSGDEGMFLRCSGGVTLSNVTFRDCWAFDPVSGSSPWTLVSKDTGSLRNFEFENSGCANASRAQIKKRTAGVSGTITGVKIRGGQIVQVVDSTGAAYAGAYGIHHDFQYGSNRVGDNSAASQPVAAQPTADGNGYVGHHLAVRGEAYSRFIQSYDGQMWWGSGSSGTLDLTVYRKVVNSATCLTTDNDIAINVAGKGIKIKEGSNAKLGTATLVAGTVTVSNTACKSTSRVFLQHLTPAGTPGWLRISAVNPSVSFTITSSSGTDTSEVAWMIVDPS